MSTARRMAWARPLQLFVFFAIFGIWYALTETGVLPPFFFGKPMEVLKVIWKWFLSGEIYPHLGITLLETLLAFVLSNARVLGASSRQLLRTVYLPSAMGWVFSSLHTSIGMAFVGAVVGEYLGSARGVGYLILQAEGTFDINTVFAGILVLTAFALLLDDAVTRAERRLLRWRPVQGEAATL